MILLVRLNNNSIWLFLVPLKTNLINKSCVCFLKIKLKDNLHSKPLDILAIALFFSKYRIDG